MPTNAEVIAKALVDEGVEYVFGLPGGEVVVLIDALRRAGLRFVLVGHEASAAFMADVTGQITGRTGVCLATLGPGAMNLVTGVANAYLERSPVLALTAQIPHDLYDSFIHQRLPLERIFAGITKQAAVLDGRQTDRAVRQALHLARTGRPGPVYLGLPGDLAAQEAVKVERPAVTADSPVSGGAEPAELVEIIVTARRPLALVGVGARAEDASAVRRFLEAAQWPWMTTPKGKGIMPEDDPRFVGVAGGMAIDDVMVETLETSDLIVGVGFDAVECDKTWFLERQIVNITPWPTAEGRYQPLEVVGSVGAILSDLATRVRPCPWPDDLLQARRRARARSPSSAGDGLSPLAVLLALRDVLPQETAFVCDVGSHKLLAGQFWRTTVPQTFFMSNGLSAMGYGLPAAIAAQLHLRDRPVVAVVGDGGMLMMVHNLPLLAALRLPIVTVVFTDGSLSLIRLGQTRRGLPAYGTDFAPPDFAKFAQACGVPAERAVTLDAVKLQVSRAVRSRAALLLDVPVDLHEYDHLV